MSMAVKYSCMRCRVHKRKCDKLLPRCSLCTRGDHVCEYEFVKSPCAVDSASAIFGDPLADLLPTDEIYEPHHIKLAIIREFSGAKPEDILSIYLRTIHPWFPIFSEIALRKSLPLAWDDAGPEFTFLCFSILLLSSSPEPAEEANKSALRFNSLYLSGKTWLSVLEGIGFNSLEMVQSRLLITLFELLHGKYPAAFISIGATVRAADALAVYTEQDESSYQSEDEDERKIETMMTWCAILVVDRHIAIENGKLPAVTKGRKLPDLSQSTGSSIAEAVPTYCHPILRLFEASSLLDKLQTALHEPVLEQSFNVEEMAIIFNTLTSFEAIMCQETQDRSRLYASSLALSGTGMLLSFENGSKKGDVAKPCWASAVVSLDSLLEEILQTIQPLQGGKEASNAHIVTPFVIYLVFKAAAIFTEKLRMGDDSLKSIQSLRSLRSALKLISQRWRAAERYLNFLDEDTTPRMLKVINQRGV